LDVFVGEKMMKHKWEKVNKLAGGRVTIHKTQFPRRDAFRFAKTSGAQLISTSNDDHCLDGYASITKELPKDIDAIFTPASSGALAVGVYRGYSETMNGEREKKHKKSSAVNFQPPIFYICQTPRAHPLIQGGSLRNSGTVFHERSRRVSSMADAISDVIGERKSEIQNIIQKTKGAGVVVEDRYIRKAMKILKKELKIENPSPNGSLAFAGLLKALTQGERFEGKKIVCLYTGS